MMTVDSSRVLDLCAGPGGWSTALASLGLTEVGIELDAAACATRAAAGHATIRADIASLPVAQLIGKLLGLIASPPCQGMSRGGLHAGWADLDLIRQLLADLAAGHDTRTAFAARVSDPRSLLIAEPLRYALAARPEWVVCEQVPAVLPLWAETARHLGGAGYSTWTGVLNAADYGLAQSRKRAFLIASRTRTVHAPAPTHSQQPDMPDLFGPALRPWASMADVLGWGATDRPTPTVTAGGGRTGGAEPFPTQARKALMCSQERGAWLRRNPATDTPESVRITAPEAAMLQGFPPAYPWQGTKTKVFEQIGNAVPPPLARAVLAVATGIEAGA